MADATGFLQAIREEPGDDGLRLIFADWLDEHGEPDRAEFIRLQVALASGTLGIAAMNAARVREHQLLHNNIGRWVGKVREVAEGWEFRRGMLHLKTGLARFLEVGKFREVPPEWAWVESLRVSGSHPPLTEAVKALAASPLLRSLAALDLSGLAVGPGGAVALADSSNLSGLSSLDLYDNALGASGAMVLVTSAHLGRLTALNLRYNGLGATGAKLLAESARLPRLEVLNLHHNGLGDAGLEDLARSVRLEGLKSLNLRYNGITLQKLPPDLPLPGALRSLGLYNNGLGDDGAKALARWRALASLAALDLGYNNISGVGGRALAESPYLAGLTVLELRGNRLSPEAASALQRRFGAVVRL